MLDCHNSSYFACLIIHGIKMHKLTCDTICLVRSAAATARVEDVKVIFKFKTNHA